MIFFYRKLLYYFSQMVETVPEETVPAAPVQITFLWVSDAIALENGKQYKLVAMFDSKSNMHRNEVATLLAKEIVCNLYERPLKCTLTFKSDADDKFHVIVEERPRASFCV